MDEIELKVNPSKKKENKNNKKGIDLFSAVKPLKVNVKFTSLSGVATSRHFSYPDTLAFDFYSPCFFPCVW